MRIVLNIDEGEREDLLDWLTCLKSAKLDAAATIQLAFTQGDTVVQGEFALVEQPMLED